MKYIIIYCKETGKCNIFTNKYENVKTFYNVKNINNIIDQYKSIEYIEYQ